jgi:hypothetical protein
MIKRWDTTRFWKRGPPKHDLQGPPRLPNSETQEESFVSQFATVIVNAEVQFKPETKAATSFLSDHQPSSSPLPAHTAMRSSLRHCKQLVTAFAPSKSHQQTSALSFWAAGECGSAGGAAASAAAAAAALPLPLQQPQSSGRAAFDLLHHQSAAASPSTSSSTHARQNLPWPQPQLAGPSTAAPLLHFSAGGVTITLPSTTTISSSRIYTPTSLPDLNPGNSGEDAPTGSGGSIDGPAGPAADPLLCIKRTWQPNVHRRKTRHGFLKR